MSWGLTRVGSYGRVWPRPHKSKRKRFEAWFERSRDIRVKHFPTRKAATDWLNLIASRTTEGDAS